MSLPMSAVATQSFLQTLTALSKILDKAAAHCAAKKIDQAVVMQTRLTPDMFPFVKQVQIACDFAKNSATRLMGQEPPRFEDNEQTLPQLRARIAKTLDHLQTVSAAGFEGAAERDIKIPLPDNKSLEMKGLPYLRDFALPNFYFHVVTAYDILRHNGVDVGKRDYLNM